MRSACYASFLWGIVPIIGPVTISRQTRRQRMPLRSCTEVPFVKLFVGFAHLLGIFEGSPECQTY
jgi:hypothetical protein